MRLIEIQIFNAKEMGKNSYEKEMKISIQLNISIMIKDKKFCWFIASKNVTL